MYIHEYTGICVHVCGQPEVEVMCFSQLFYNIFMEEEPNPEPTFSNSTVYWSNSQLALGSSVVIG